MPGQFRYTNPTPPRTASGRTADVFAQIREDLGRDKVPTFQVLSPSYELLSATWSLLRETLLAGEGSRTGKEIAALGVSQANRCRFCVDAHTLFLHATGDHRLAEHIAAGGTPEDDHQAHLLSWAVDSREPGKVTAPPVARGERAAYIGTALAFHFINRIASALLTPNLLPGDAQKYRAVRSVAGRSFARVVRRTPEPGLSLPLLTHRTAGPGWAAGSPPVAGAYAALRSAATLGGELLDEEARAYVSAQVAQWNGEHPPLAWTALPARTDRPGTRLALLAALAPYRITDEDVAAWRTPESPYTDHCLVHLIAYGAFLAVDRIATAFDATAFETTFGSTSTDAPTPSTEAPAPSTDAPAPEPLEPR
ncbi:carboxymuconolactone decarboxylase family protein [Streptomyces sp. NPDC050418]|uniref:carboxymuconolactone decarboxylase family protein n=1 Tax=Streptomyces sp. NPDC050418 TaxID=3365612 RepID=UPI0037B8ECC7